MNDLIDRYEVIELLKKMRREMITTVEDKINALPSAEPEIIRCKDCKWWRQQTNYQGIPLSFGFCESDDMWRSLYGETYEVSHITTDDDFYCGYADMRGEEETCENCKHNEKPWHEEPCDSCTMGGDTHHFEPKEGRT